MAATIAGHLLNIRGIIHTFLIVQKIYCALFGQKSDKVNNNMNNHE